MRLPAFLKTFAVSPLPLPQAWFALPLRLIVGYGFLAHGLAKLSRGADVWIGILAAIGVPLPGLSGWGTIAVEVVGGLMILLGALVPLAALPMAGVLLGAILTVQLPNGFSSIKLQSFDRAGAHFGQPGYETNLLYLAGLAALCVGGAGPLSVDSFVKRTRPRTPGDDRLVDRLRVGRPVPRHADPVDTRVR